LLAEARQPGDALTAVAARRFHICQCMLPAVVTEFTWFYWALLSAAFAALTAIFAKLGVQGVDADLATLLRTLVIAVVLGLIVLAGGKWVNPIRLRTQTLWFLLLSGLATGASWVCYFRALKLGPASKVAPIDKLSVVLVAVFALLFLGERPSARDWTGIALIAVGVLVLGLRH
jgi:transporter family protein